MLSRIDKTDAVDESNSPKLILKEVCDKLNDTMILLMHVNNECIELRKQIEELKKQKC